MRATFDLPALPAQSNHVCLYATHLFSLGLQPSSIRNYLTAVAFAHKINGFKDPTDTFKVRKLLDAIKREANCSTFTRQPITKKVLSKLLQGIVKVEKSKYNKKLFKALFSFMYHAGLRVSEVAVSAQSNHTIQVEDVKKTAKAVSLRLRSFKHSKQCSANIRLRPTKNSTCPVRAYNKYMTLRGDSKGPLFRTKNKVGLSRDKIASVLKKTLTSLCLQPDHYNTHSFRIGKITDLAMSGSSFTTIKTVGRFHSHAYLRYIKPPVIKAS